MEWGGLIDLSGYVENRTTVHLFASTNVEVSLFLNTWSVLFLRGYFLAALNSMGGRVW